MATLVNIAIERRSSAEQVAQVIKEMLLRGEVAPGTKLFDIPIAAQLQVSRHTVREAMHLLAAEGLVKHNFQRGVTVAELTEHELNDLFRARRALETAGALAGRVAATADLDALRSAVRDMRVAAEENNWSASVASDLNFHRAVVGLIGSDLLNRFYLNVQAKLRLTRAWAEREHASPAELWNLHKPVLVAIEDRHYGEAADDLLEILAKGEDRLRRAIQARIAGDPTAEPARRDAPGTKRGRVTGQTQTQARRPDAASVTSPRGVKKRARSGTVSRQRSRADRNRSASPR